MATLKPNPSSQSPQTLLEAGVSSLSLNSSIQGGGEDWDQSIIIEPNGHDSESTRRPSTPPAQTRKGLPEPDGTPDMGTKSRASLSELLRRHAEKGRELKLSDEDEERLSEELGNWINSDSSPYETAAGDSSRRGSTAHEQPNHSTPPTSDAS